MIEVFVFILIGAYMIYTNLKIIELESKVDNLYKCMDMLLDIMQKTCKK